MGGKTRGNHDDLALHKIASDAAEGRRKGKSSYAYAELVLVIELGITTKHPFIVSAVHPSLFFSSRVVLASVGDDGRRRKIPHFQHIFLPLFLSPLFMEAISREAYLLSSRGEERKGRGTLAFATDEEKRTLRVYVAGEGGLQGLFKASGDGSKTGEE